MGGARPPARGPADAGDRRAARHFPGDRTPALGRGLAEARRPHARGHARPAPFHAGLIPPEGRGRFSRSPSDRLERQAHAVAMATIEHEETEADRVAAWRFEVLVRTGYSPAQARKLAAACPPAVAARILA